jgi:phosphatidate cytidylyltransferase
MSNTTKRILSAIVLIFLVILCFVSGKEVAFGALLLFSVIITDELYCNFFRKKRFSPLYFLSQAIVIFPYVLVNYFYPVSYLVSGFAYVGIIFNLSLIVFLFYLDIDSQLLVKSSSAFPWISGLYSLICFMALTSLFHFDEWIRLFVVLLCVAYGMDTGAWFFGKNFGKRKLWPKVSPNKTVEGLIGGILTAGFMGGASWNISFGTLDYRLFVLFCFLGLMSQVGDLVQSKIKRQFDIKDSSSLIPGHGGVYDRFDSLLFVAPFYKVVISYFL